MMFIKDHSGLVVCIISRDGKKVETPVLPSVLIFLSFTNFWFCTQLLKFFFAFFVTFVTFLLVFAGF